MNKTMKVRCVECERLQRIAYEVNKAFAIKDKNRMHIDELRASIEKSFKINEGELEKYIERARHLTLEGEEVIMSPEWFEKLKSIFKGSP